MIETSEMVKLGTEIRFNIPYPFKSDEEHRFAEAGTTSQVCRQITEQLIIGAATLLYPQGMSRAESRIFGEIQAALHSPSMSVVLSDHAAEFLFDLFLSDDATTRVKFRPEAALWFCTWVEYLENVKEHAGATG